MRKPSEGREGGEGRERHVERPAHAERENLVHRLWDRLDEDLQRALSLGYDLARREEKTRISTRTFFAAIARLWPAALQPLLRDLPEGALPRAPMSEVHLRSDILREDPQLSTCLENTLRELSRAAGPERRITITDAFVDLATYGTGDSVEHLRARGVTPAWIDQWIRRHEARVLRRRDGAPPERHAPRPRD